MSEAQRQPDSRDAKAGAAMPAVMQLTVEGDATQGGAGQVALAPIELSIGRHRVLRGSAPLPDDLRPRQTTIQLLDRAGGKPLGMRVLLVQ
ncbi:MAG TPA: hypothetical protein DCY13_06285 [Verrucomicrobiales bacterium]|nr:hypothetical protein [Verrucomicrobiales bacterium]